ncbi:hypothetical protein ACIBQX_26105 [Nonomuraea sp. NPDC049714]|uniref:hypothetical protein n=1 Tax=Nonomuraea sp. NPDC049714 TaxID=3364357 RepID=UPI0037BD94CA
MIHAVILPHCDSWTKAVLPSLTGLVEIPAVSAAYDAEWEEHGHLRAAVEHVQAWVTSRALPDARCEVVQLDGRAPLLFVDVPATSGAASSGTVLLYGHLDGRSKRIREGWTIGFRAAGSRFPPRESGC